jgi:hypothetical protein
MYDPLQALTVKEVSAILGKCENTITSYIKQGKLKHIKRYEGQRKPQRIFIIRKDLEEFIYGEWNNYGKYKGNS